MTVMWSIPLSTGGAVVLVRIAASRGARPGGLRRDLAVVGLALLLAGVVELAHGLDLLRSGFFHLVFAACLGVAGAVLATVHGTGGTQEEGRVVGAFRVAGAILVLAAAVRVFLVAARDVHGVSGGIWAILLALAGVALVRATRTTEPFAWQGL